MQIDVFLLCLKSGRYPIVWTKIWKLTRKIYEDLFYCKLVNFLHLLQKSEKNKYITVYIRLLSDYQNLQAITKFS